MALASDCPAIHVAFTALADDGLLPWVRVGAEEEGVPCRAVPLPERTDVLALAFAAAESSRLNIGVGVDRSEIVLHEVHMPPRQPVLRFRFDGRFPYICRLMGSNAARMVVRLPFRFPGEETVAAEPAPALSPAPRPPAAPAAAIGEEVDPREIARIVALVVRKLAERGIR